MGSGHRQPPLSRLPAKSCPVIAAVACGDFDRVRAMADLQTLDLILFAAGTFAAALVTGVAGFAFGIVAAAVWLYFLPPAPTTALIVAYGLIVQGISVWKLRRSIKLGRLLPFLLGGAIGVPIGVELLHWTSPATLRISVGIVLILFSLYSLMRPQLAPVPAGKAADGRLAYSTASSAAPPDSPGLSPRSGAPCGVGRATSNAPPSSRLGSGSS
jgi:uncharacterized membrane protein YfcA